MTPVLHVALPVPLHAVFDYRHPHAVDAGCRVLVPFGQREVVGVVVGASDASEVDPARLKAVVRVLDEAPLPTAELLATLQWAARYYQYPLGEVLQAALPVALRSARPLPLTGTPTLLLTTAGAAACADPSRRRGTR